MNDLPYELLDQIDNPDDLKLIAKDKLSALCAEIREYLLESVSKSSGHLASNLGVIELTVALHYVYNTPYDKLIWDVGHQAYAHKILTGRKNKLATIRTFGGLHPFPFRSESDYDVLSVGHSSTSISAALGLSLAQRNFSLADPSHVPEKTVCVIGDGAITAGMAFEALNHAGSEQSDMLVILNDNNMSISKNVGALNNHLVNILSGNLYSNLREGGKKLFSNTPAIKNLIKKTEEKFKGLVIPTGTLFEHLGFNYIGPVDGHDVNGLVTILNNMKTMKGPQLLHVLTTKGKGYTPAELDPIGYHGVPKFDRTKSSLPVNSSNYTYSNLFGDWLIKQAKQEQVSEKSAKLMAVTPAMGEGSGMMEFAKQFPQQYFDVAIAEQHALTLAAGFAIAKLKPVVAIYSTFLQRAYDQLIHDIALDKLDVLLAIDRAGIVGADGQTHQGAFDLSFMQTIPNLTIMTPSDANECWHMLDFGYNQPSPCAVRYPRGQVKGQIDFNDTELAQDLANFKSKLILKHCPNAITGHKKIALLNFGSYLDDALTVSQELGLVLIDMRFVKPLDLERIKSLIDFDLVVTLEENAIIGGAGSSVNQALNSLNLNIPCLNLGFSDKFIPMGDQAIIKTELNLDSIGVKNSILQKIKNI